MLHPAVYSNEFPSVEFSNEEIAQVTKTARATGCIGEKAIIPRIVPDFCTTGLERILDFGCGKHQIHVKQLLDEGLFVIGYDFSIPESYWTLEDKWEIIYASNVLNVQTDISMLRRTLRQISDILIPGGTFLCNYPQPRHLPIDPYGLQGELEMFFFGVEKLKQHKGHYIWHCTGEAERGDLH